MHKALFHKLMSYSVCYDIVFHIVLIFVFTPIGTNLYKDKVMGLTDQGRQRGCSRVPTAVFANRRKVLNQGRYLLQCSNSQAKLTGGFQPRVDQVHIPQPSLSIPSDP